MLTPPDRLGNSTPCCGRPCQERENLVLDDWKCSAPPSCIHVLHHLCKNVIWYVVCLPFFAYFLSAPSEGGGKADKVHMAIRHPDYQIMGMGTWITDVAPFFLIPKVEEPVNSRGEQLSKESESTTINTQRFYPWISALGKALLLSRMASAYLVTCKHIYILQSWELPMISCRMICTRLCWAYIEDAF
jgi:hypothetical protein